MPRRALGFLAASPICLFAAVVVCYPLVPGADLRGHGISVYGNYRASLVPYSLGLIGAAVCLALGASALPEAPVFRQPRRLLWRTSAAVIAVLLTPSAWSAPVGWVHLAAGVTMFGYQLVLGWVLYRAARSPLMTALVAFQFAGAALACLSLLHVVRLMSFGQLLAEAGFGALLVAGLLGQPAHG